MLYGLYPKGIDEAKTLVQAESRKNAINYFAKLTDMPQESLTTLYEVKPVDTVGKRYN